MASRASNPATWITLIVGVALVALAANPAHAGEEICTGDCDDSGTVSINELILGVNMSLGLQPVSACPAFDCQNDGTVPVNCLIQGVNNSLFGCNPTGCPLAAGTYTVTQTAGGSLRIGNLSTIPFPAGGTIIMDVGPGQLPECVHDVVIKNPGGFTAPAFCIAAFGFTVTIVQSGCGVGQIDSNGGADYTIDEVGDTSSMPECNNQQECVEGVDSKIRVDVTVGDGTPDTCTGGGTANGVVTIPVLTTSYIDRKMPQMCPGSDGMYNPDVDQLILQVDQILDFTTDSNTSVFDDLSGDGCDLAGVGPMVGFANTGTCWNIEAGTIGMAASGTVGSDGAPLYDFAFSSLLPNTVTGPTAPQGATCDSPPPFEIGGTAIRCLE